MEWDHASSNDADMAARISEFQKEELAAFMRDSLRRRDLHRVVANLNDTALSKDDPRSASARKALKRLGFAD